MTLRLPLASLLTFGLLAFPQAPTVDPPALSNPYARVCFRLGDFDAKKLEEGFSFFKAKDLQNLSVGEAIMRMERAEYDFNLKTVPLPAVDTALPQAAASGSWPPRASGTPRGGRMSKRPYARDILFRR